MKTLRLFCLGSVIFVAGSAAVALQTIVTQNLEKVQLTAPSSSPKVGTFQEGCELLQSIANELDPRSWTYPTPISACAALRRQVQEVGIQQAAQKCEDGMKVAYTLATGVPPGSEVPSQMKYKMGIACNWILVGPY
jgi:hypothetical protein